TFPEFREGSRRRPMVPTTTTTDRRRGGACPCERSWLRAADSHAKGAVCKFAHCDAALTEIGQTGRFAPGVGPCCYTLNQESPRTRRSPAPCPGKNIEKTGFSAV